MAELFDRVRGVVRGAVQKFVEVQQSGKVVSPLRVPPEHRQLETKASGTQRLEVGRAIEDFKGSFQAICGIRLSHNQLGLTVVTEFGIVRMLKLGDAFPYAFLIEPSQCLSAVFHKIGRPIWIGVLKLAQQFFHLVQ
jgi:hypothetical protein